MSQTIDYQQSSFNAGELSPLVKGREGLAKFKSGLKTCENALVLAHGPVTARGGLRYIGDVKDHNKEVRLVPFEFNKEQAYVLEMGDEYMRVWMDGGQVVTPDSDTILLLHMNGDDGDIDFVDKSADAHAISVHGDAQVDIVDPVYTIGDEPGNLLLDGDDDYLIVADHAKFVYGTDPLTIDHWFYIDNAAGEQIFYFHEDTTYDYKWIALWIDPQSNEIYFAYSEGAATGQIRFDYSTGFAIDTWYHLALIRGWGGNANDWMVTINGIACGSAQTVNMNLPDYDKDPQIGAATTKFIPDHSSLNRTVKPQGNAVTSADHYKWGNGSIKLDGTGDFVRMPDALSWDLQTNENIELWVKHNNHLGQEGYIAQCEDLNNKWSLRHEHGDGIKFLVVSGGSTIVTTYSGEEITDTDWHHIVVVKLGSHYGIYKDGVLICCTLDASMDTFAANLDIGRHLDGAGTAQYLDGYVDDVRLIHANDYGVDPLDWLKDSSDFDHTVVPRDGGDEYKWGPAPNFTSGKKWGNSGIYLDGTDDEFRVPYHSTFHIADTRTIDIWVRHFDHVDKEGYIIQYEGVGNGWRFYHNHGTGLVFHVRTGGVNVIALAGGEITDNSWHHVAMCKIGSTWGLYLDGTQTAYLSDASGDTFVGTELRIGVMKDNAGLSKFFKGWMDELNYSQANVFGASPNVGMTDTITVPTGAHTSNSDTKLLLHFDSEGLTVPTSKHMPDSDTVLLLRGDVMDVAGGVDEYRVSLATRWTSDFPVNTKEYPGAGGSTPYELASIPWTEEQVSALKWAGVGDVLYVVHPEVAVYKISRTDHDVWTCEIVDWDSPPWNAINDTAITLDPAAVTGSDIAIVASAAFFTSSHVGTYFKQANGFYLITAVTDSTNAVADIKDDLDDHVATANWYMSAWNSIEGYPSCITFFEDRLCLAGAGGEPTKVRFSETGDYENMEVGVDDSDPMAYQLLSHKFNRILWLVGGKKLFIGTTGAEFWMSGAAVNAPITPTSVLARRESTIGSEDIQPVTIGSSLMFIQRAGRTVNLWKYEYVNDSFEATDLGILAEHLTKDHAIADIQYAQDPDHIAWILRTDGRLLGLTHMADHDVTGWHKHITADKTAVGDVETFAVIPGSSQSVAVDELWVVTKRTIDGSTARYIEMLTPRFGNFGIQYAMQTDSCISYTGSPATVFSGADHLEGEAVNIIADGKVFNTTISGGGFTLATAASVVTIGLPFTVTVEFMVALLTELMQGITTAKRKRIVELLIMMYETCQLDYGVNASDMFDVWDATGLADNTLNDEYVKVEVDGNPEYEPTLLLEQNHPYPFTLLGIVETIEVED